MPLTFERITEKYVINNLDYEIKDNILKLFNNKIIDENLLDNNRYLVWIGNYYRNIGKDYDKMKKYYLMAIDNGNSMAINNLGHYYHYIEKDYKLMEKYYLMAINNGNNNAM